MKNRKPIFAAVVLALLFACWAQFRPTPLAAQEEQAGAKEQQSAVQEQPATRKAPRGRLPQYYGQIGLTREQREKIYAIQAKYQAQIDELLKQIEELRNKEQQEIEAVLIPEQKQLLKRLQEEAKKRRASRRKASANNK